MVMVSELTIQTKALESSSSETSITPPTTSTDTDPHPITTDTSDPEGRPATSPSGGGEGDDGGHTILHRRGGRQQDGLEKEKEEI